MVRDYRQHCVVRKNVQVSGMPISEEVQQKGSLLVYMADGSTQAYTLDKPVLKVGRAPDNDIVLVDPERSVSRWHAAISIGTGGVSIEDLNSSNGTFVDGKLIRGQVHLKPGAMVSLGGFKIRLLDEAGHFGIEVQRLGLVIHVKGGQFDLHLLSLLSHARL